MYLAAKSVEPLPNYHLRITFEDGQTRILDVEPWLDRGIFRELRDPALFSAVRIAFDAVEWPNGADLCPETLYDASVPA